MSKAVIIGAYKSEEVSNDIEIFSSESESLMMSRRGKTFSWSSLFLPKTIREELNELYSFCRYVDDCADNGDNKANAARLLERVVRDLGEGKSSLKVVENFLELSERRKIPISFALELIEGVKADLGIVRFSSEEELLRYSYQVAGTVGAMICHLLAITDRNAIAAGIDLAVGMQLTNIARDVEEDYNRNRVYIPASLISPDILPAAFANRDGARKHLVNALNRIAGTANSYYRSADEGICYLPAQVRLGILAASRAYEKIFRIIVNDPDRYFQGRVVTTDLEKAGCLFDAAWSLTKPKYHRAVKAPAHRSELHRAFRGLPSFEFV